VLDELRVVVGAVEGQGSDDPVPVIEGFVAEEDEDGWVRVNSTEEEAFADEVEEDAEQAGEELAWEGDFFEAVWVDVGAEDSADEEDDELD
jgi:hypothetical protein